MLLKRIHLWSHSAGDPVRKPIHLWSHSAGDPVRKPIHLWSHSAGDLVRKPIHLRSHSAGNPVRKGMTIVLISALFLVLCGCLEKPAAEDGKLSVAVTTDAVYELALAVGGERVVFSRIIPEGAPAHDFEPLAKDLALLGSASVFITNGLGLEPWAEDAASAAGNEELVMVDASTGISPVSLSEDGGPPYDPHIWLSLKCAAIMAENIEEALAEADPGGADYYALNCEQFTRGLNELFDEYNGKIQNAESKTIVTGHAVFEYLCRDFGLTQRGIEGVFAEGEPSALELSALVDYCVENGVKTILAENLSSPLLSQTLAREAGASVKTVYTLEGPEDGLSYMERMTENLAVILSSL